MPDPFFSGGKPGQKWLQNVNAWNQDRGQTLYKPEKYGLLTGTPDEKIRDQEMMDLILAALLGGPAGPGVDIYKFAPKEAGKAPTPTPTPTPVDVIKTGAKTGYRTSDAEEKYRRLVGGN